MGEIQSVAGALILVFWIAWYRASASWRPIRFGLERVPILAVSQIFCATDGVTREKAVVRNCDIDPACVSFSIVTSCPNSIPYGCGFISTGSRGISVVERV